ncbi:MAG: metal ABC transporter permease, partial [Negativicoccus succinicivorans]|nr:metal ABC transporter permease [Negativicoccus succinicivorans]
MSPLSDYTFQIVAAGTMLLGLASGVTGTFAVLRKESLIGDGLSHASFPGVVAAFMFLAVKDLEVLLTGAAVASLLCMAAIALT